LINDFALYDERKGSTLFFANIYKLRGLIHLNKNNIEEAKISFDKAMKSFSEIKSDYG
jgi:predicted negative regulator of RcsB-dependent stress response